MGSDKWAQWLTGVGAFLVVVSVGIAIWLQLVTDTAGTSFSNFDVTQRLVYLLYSLIPIGVGVAVVALGRILAALNGRGAADSHPI